MPNWSFSDGTKMTSGGSVHGSSRLAEDLRYEVGLARAGRHPTVAIGAMPDGYVELDPDSDEHLNALAAEKAQFRRVAVETDYRNGNRISAVIDLPVPGRIY